MAAVKRKRLFWIISLLTAITAAVWLFAPRQGPISRTAYGRIQLGMSKDDVLAVMMVPPGDYTTDFYTSVGEESEGHLQTGKRLWWISNHALVEVYFDEQEQVCGKELHIIQTQGSIQQKIESLRWSIKSWFRL
jgi:hypothetical protein